MMHRCDFRVSESAKKRKYGFRKRKRKVNEEEGRRDLGFGVGKRKGTSSTRKEDLRRRYVDDSDEERSPIQVPFRIRRRENAAGDFRVSDRRE
ncbi:unnamed protein product [Microthlaspi erraticum]|uniref:Uncharacterized protein n=1 Tax=Microthlaspi erraticum TaxID=1685480 RepID=A0A6D2IAZ9_9BRAS|nr:unnamed protein product [Microthlaspi erraticum]